MDGLAVHLAMPGAAAHMRRGGGPTVVEVDTYRFFHQNGGFAGSAFGYRTKEEEKQWRDRDPLTQTASQLVRRGLLTEDETRQAVTQAKAVMEEVGSVILEPDREGKPGQRRIKPDEWPDPAWVDVGVRGDLSELASAAVVEDEASVAVEEMKFIDAVATVMGRRMETDDGVVVMGEDVHRLNGGTNGATRDLVKRFPGRVLG